MGRHRVRDEWTFMTLKDYFERIIKEHDRLYDERFESQTEALTRTGTAIDRRFESVNEFRGQLSDQARTFMTRDEATQRIDSLAEKIDILSRIAERRSGQSTGLSAGWGYLVSLVTVSVLVVSVILIALR